MSKKNGGGAPKLDLGIQAILAKSTSLDNPAKATLDVQTAPTKIFTLDDADGELSPEYQSLAQTKQWGILVSTTEAAISEGSDVEARLWWIRGHLGALSLPVSLLAAPFETICRQLSADSKLADLYKPLLIEIGSIMCERLRGVGDRRQEHAVMLGLHRLGLYNQEKEGARPAWGKVPPTVPRFELGTPKLEPSPQKTPPLGRPGRRPSAVLLLALIILLLGTIVGLLWQRLLTQEPVVVASESLLVADTAAVLRPPLVEPRPALSNLDALYYSISESGRQDPSITAQAAEAGVPSKMENAPSLAREGIQAPPVEKPAAQSREVVNTDGPVEGKEFQRGVERAGAQQARLPEPSLDLQPKPVPSAGYPEVDGVLRGEVKSVLVTTNVLDSPSYRARIIAKLREGDKVSVEARAGRWVRIRSKRGKTGYVFAQDVGENEDFRSP